jgi:DNA helicase-2/ATP-dependent DNA helicase PcrA
VWYGSAVHYALQKLFGEMLRAKDKQFPSEEDFIGYFEKDMYAHRGQVKERDFQRRLVNGRNNLREYYRQNIHKWDKNVVIEKTLFAESDGVPLRGVLDKIAFLTDSIVHITDYKTGKPDETRIRRPTPKNPNGGYYWRQLVFYKILYENYRSHLVRVKTGEISYLEPDAKGFFKSKILDIEPKDVEQLRGVIVAVWQNINNHNFKGCGKKDCRWCCFVKHNQTADTFGNAILEDMDD